MSEETKTVDPDVVVVDTKDIDTVNETKLEVVQPATLESLKAVKYQNLKETFTILGVPSAWKPGSKATKMIADALEKLAVIRDLETKGFEGEELEKAAQLKNEENQEAAKQAAQEAEEAIEEAKTQEQEDYKQSVIKMKLSDEQIEEAIKNIDANLKVGVEAQRPILLSKRAVLIEILEEKE